MPQVYEKVCGVAKVPKYLFSFLFSCLRVNSLVKVSFNLISNSFKVIFISNNSLVLRAYWPFFLMSLVSECEFVVVGILFAKKLND